MNIEQIKELWCKWCEIHGLISDIEDFGGKLVLKIDLKNCSCYIETEDEDPMSIYIGFYKKYLIDPKEIEGISNLFTQFYEILQQLKDFNGDADAWLTTAIIKKFKINNHILGFSALSSFNNIIKVMGIEIDIENYVLLSVTKVAHIKFVEDLIKIVKTYKLLKEIKNEK